MNTAISISLKKKRRDFLLKICQKILSNTTIFKVTQKHKFVNCVPLSLFTGKLVSIKGTVIRVGNTKLQATWLAFKCSGCEGVQSVRQPEGSIVQPTQCPEKTCRSRSFTPLQDSSHTQTVNWQLIRLQEILSDDQVC